MQVRIITRRNSFILSFLASTVAAAAAHAQFGGPAQVEVEPIKMSDIAPTARLVGTINPQRRTVLATEVAGAVVELTVDIGDRVRKGELLCHLRDSTQQFDLTAAQARRDEWQAELQIERANLTKARFEKDRIAKLASLQRSTEKEVNDSQADLLAAEQRVARADARIAAAAAEIALARDRLEHMHIKAPFDGVVVRKLTELGQWVETGGQIFEILDLSTVRARVNVHESAIVYCQVGQVVSVTVAGWGDSYQGMIGRIVPDADVRARTFPVEIDIPNEAGVLRSGMFVHAALPSGPQQSHLIVPKDAVVLNGAAKTIWIARPNDAGHVAAPLPVELIAEAQDSYAVSAQGLNAGDLVIVRGNESLRGPGPVIVRRQPETVATPNKIPLPTTQPTAKNPARINEREPS